LALSFRLPAREFLEALDDDIAIKRVELHEECPTARLLGRNQGRAATAKEVEDILALARSIKNRPSQ
jgi:hypothetical protein